MNLFSSMSGLAEVTRPLEVFDIGVLSGPVVFRGHPLKKGLLTTMVNGVVHGSVAETAVNQEQLKAMEK